MASATRPLPIRKIVEGSGTTLLVSSALSDSLVTVGIIWLMNRSDHTVGRESGAAPACVSLKLSRLARLPLPTLKPAVSVYLSVKPPKIQATRLPRA